MRANLVFYTLQVRLIRSNIERQPGTISMEVTEQTRLFYIENRNLTPFPAYAN